MILYKLIGYDPVTNIYTNPDTSQAENLPSLPFVIDDTPPTGYAIFDEPENWDKYAITLVGTVDGLDNFELYHQICTRIEIIAGTDYSDYADLSAEQQRVALFWCCIRIIRELGNSFYISKFDNEDISKENLDNFLKTISYFSSANQLLFRIKKDHTHFQSASLTNAIEIFLLPARYMMIAVFMRHSVKFEGTLILTYNISVGVDGNLIRYASPFLVSTVVSDTNFQTSQNFFLENWKDGVTTVKAQGITTGANLDQSTDGEVEIMLLISRVK